VKETGQGKGGRILKTAEDSGDARVIEEAVASVEGASV
jgi:hypothetical protein